MHVPSGWRKLSLSRVAEIRTGVAKGKKNLKDPIELPYLRVANVQDGYIDLSEVKHIQIERSQIERFSLKNGDVLMTEGGDFDKLGRGDVWNGKINPCLHQNHVFAVRPNQLKLDSYFLAALSASHYGKTYFLSCSKQSTNLASINSTQLKDFPVLLPPLPEQQKIAQILSTWDKAIEKLEALIAAKQKRKKALMQQLLTGKKRFAGFEGEWNWVRFDQILDIEIGGTPSRKNPDYWDKEKFSQNRWLSIRDLKGNVIEDTKEYITDLGVKNSNVTLIPAGSVVMSFKLTIGKKAILDKDCYTNEAICSLIPKDLNRVTTDFLIQVLDIVNFEDEIDQAIKGKTLNKAKLKRLKINLPPLAEQQKIASVLSVADTEIQIHQKQLSALKEQKNGLMQQLLTGKKRVKIDSKEVS